VGAGLGLRGGDLDPRPAASAGLSPSGVYQLAADAELDALDAALSELRAGRPRGSRCGDTIADRLSDEWTGCGAAGTGSYTWTLAATRQHSACAGPPTGRTGPSWPT